MITKLFDTFDLNTLDKRSLERINQHNRSLNETVNSICMQLSQSQEFKKKSNLTKSQRTEIYKDIRKIANDLLCTNMSRKLIEEVYNVNYDTVSEFETRQQILTRDYAKLNNNHVSADEINSIISRYAEDKKYYTAMANIRSSLNKSRNHIIEKSIERLSQFENNYDTETAKNDISLIVNTYSNSIMSHQKQKENMRAKYNLGGYILDSFADEIAENIYPITSLCLRAKRKDNRPHLEYEDYTPQKTKNNPPTK